MNHCIRLLLLFTPSLVALGLLGIAFGTNWWTIALERVNILIFPFCKLIFLIFRIFLKKIPLLHQVMNNFIRH
jgi:hypothetical protein